MKAPSSLEAVVVEYRSPERTARCIEALLAGGVATVKIVDNSDDCGRTRSFLKRLLPPAAAIEIIDAGGNTGFARGVNLGVESCEGDRILLINNDAVVEEGAIAALSDALDATPSIAIAFPALLHAGRRLSRVYYNRWIPLITSRGWPGSYEVPRGCCMLLSRSRLPDGPLMDERFFMYGEELQLGWRLAREQIGIAYVDSALVVHVGSAAAVRGSAFYEERTALGHVLMQDEFCTGGVTDSPRRLVSTAGLLMRALLRAVRSRSFVPLRAYRVARCAGAGVPVSMASPERSRSEVA